MYRFWNTILEPLLQSIHAESIVEIGVADGKNTKNLLAFAAKQNGTLHAVDPAPTCDMDLLKTTYGASLNCIRELSLNALPDIDRYDAVLIDGDHNWFTVYHELLIIEKHAKKTGVFPLVLLHDIGWPYGRRDLYYDPNRIPLGYRNAYVQGGILPLSHEVTPGRGINANFFHAIYENNVRNGVRTAVEDFLEHTELPMEFIPVPGNHGLGILAAQSLIDRHPAFSVILGAMRISPEMIRYVSDLESERLGSYIHEGQLQASADVTDMQREAFIAELGSLRKAIAEKELHLQETERRAETERMEMERHMEAERMETEEQKRTLRGEWIALESKEKELSIRTEETEKIRMTQSAEREAIETAKREVLILRQQAHDDDIALRKRANALEKQEQDIAWLRREAEAQIKESQKQISWAKLEQERAVTIADTCRNERHAIARELTATQELVARQEANILRILRSKSWRMTAPLRGLDAARTSLSSQRIAYAVFSNLKDLWSDFGEPFPGLIRFVRHNLLGHIWPVKPPVLAADLLPTSPNTVAVVIPCHNYAQFLTQAIESVLAQTVPVTEIIVVDDASEDATHETAHRYAGKGVRYLRGNWRSVGAARNAGIAATSAEYLIFLDADDILHPEYVRLALEVLRSNLEAGIAYGNQQFFGDRDLYFEAPATFDWKRFDSINHINASAVIRRTALMQAGMFSHGVDQDGDWITWRRILRLGWQAMKFEGTMFYRSHEDSMTAGLIRRQLYAERAGFFEEPATLFVSLSGRTWAWPKTSAFLERQTFPHDRLHVVILDTSQDETFGTTVRKWLEQCDYRSFTYLRENIGRKGLADTDRSDEKTKQEVADACAKIYNRFARNCTTTLACILEDDVIPPIDAYARLIGHFREDVATVSACYFHRKLAQPVAWTWDKMTGLPAFALVTNGVTSVGGNGFGCLVVRGERLRHTVFHAGPPYGNYDHNFYHVVTEQDGQTALLDWDCICEHMQAPQ